MDDSPPAHGRFGTTRWSLVIRAGGGNASSEIARSALETLCQTYWYPLYAYARRKGNAPPDAEDLTQGFFCQLLEAMLQVRKAYEQHFATLPAIHDNDGI